MSSVSYRTLTPLKGGESRYAATPSLQAKLHGRIDSINGRLSPVSDLRHRGISVATTCPLLSATSSSVFSLSPIKSRNPYSSPGKKLLDIGFKGPPRDTTPNYRSQPLLQQTMPNLSPDARGFGSLGQIGTSITPLLGGPSLISSSGLSPGTGGAAVSPIRSRASPVNQSGSSAECSSPWISSSPSSSSSATATTPATTPTTTTSSSASSSSSSSSASYSPPPLGRGYSSQAFAYFPVLSAPPNCGFPPIPCDYRRSDARSRSASVSKISQTYPSHQAFLSGTSTGSSGVSFGFFPLSSSTPAMTTGSSSNNAFSNVPNTSFRVQNRRDFAAAPLRDVTATSAPIVPAGAPSSISRLQARLAFNRHRANVQAEIDSIPEYDDPPPNIVVCSLRGDVVPSKSCLSAKPEGKSYVDLFERRPLSVNSSGGPNSERSASHPSISTAGSISSTVASVCDFASYQKKGDVLQSPARNDKQLRFAQTTLMVKFNPCKAPSRKWKRVVCLELVDKHRAGEFSNLAEPQQPPLVLFHSSLDQAQLPMGFAAAPLDTLKLKSRLGYHATEGSPPALAETSPFSVPSTKGLMLARSLGPQSVQTLSTASGGAQDVKGAGQTENGAFVEPAALPPKRATLRLQSLRSLYHSKEETVSSPLPRNRPPVESSSLEINNSAALQRASSQQVPPIDLIAVLHGGNKTRAASASATEEEANPSAPEVEQIKTSPNNGVPADEQQDACHDSRAKQDPVGSTCASDCMGQPMASSECTKQQESPTPAQQSPRPPPVHHHHHHHHNHHQRPPLPDTPSPALGTYKPPFHLSETFSASPLELLPPTSGQKDPASPPSEHFDAPDTSFFARTPDRSRSPTTSSATRYGHSLLHSFSRTQSLLDSPRVPHSPPNLATFTPDQLDLPLLLGVPKGIFSARRSWTACGDSSRRDSRSPPRCRMSVFDDDELRYAMPEHSARTPPAPSTPGARAAEDPDHLLYGVSALPSAPSGHTTCPLPGSLTPLRGVGRGAGLIVVDPPSRRHRDKAKDDSLPPDRRVSVDSPDTQGSSSDVNESSQGSASRSTGGGGYGTTPFARYHSYRSRERCPNASGSYGEPAAEVERRKVHARSRSSGLGRASASPPGLFLSLDSRMQPLQLTAAVVSSAAVSSSGEGYSSSSLSSSSPAVDKEAYAWQRKSAEDQQNSENNVEANSGALYLSSADSTFEEHAEARVRRDAPSRERARSPNATAASVQYRPSYRQSISFTSSCRGSRSPSLVAIAASNRRKGEASCLHGSALGHSDGFGIGSDTPIETSPPRDLVRGGHPAIRARCHASVVSGDHSRRTRTSTKAPPAFGFVPLTSSSTAPSSTAHPLPLTHPSPVKLA